MFPNHPMLTLWLVNHDNNYFDITECCKTHQITLKNKQLKRFFLSQAIIENDCDGLKKFATIVAIDKNKMIL